MNQRDPSAHAQPLLLIACVAVFGGFLFGYDTAVINGVTPYLKSLFALTPAQEGAAGASAILGCIPGAMFAGFLSDRHGRRRVLFACALLYALSGVLSALPRDFSEFLAARFISGLGIGASSMICPVYIAELAPADRRGRLGSLFQLGIVTGIFLTLFINARIQSRGDESWNTASGWRWMLGAEVVPALVFLALLVRAPESPRWAAGAAAEGGSATGTARFGELFGPRWRRPILIAVLLMGVSQFCGINAIMYYSTKIFTTAGVGVKDSFSASVVVGLVNLLFTLVAIAFVDRAGRRPLLLAGLGAQVLALGAVSLMFHRNAGGAGLLAAIVTFIAAFAMALGQVPWIVSSEIFPTRLRGRAMSLATFVIWSSCYAVAQTFPILNDHPSVGPARTFALYALTSLIGLVLVAACLPETKGRTLEEIESSWGGRGGRA